MLLLEVLLRRFYVASLYFCEKFTKFYMYFLIYMRILDTNINLCCRFFTEEPTENGGFCYIALIQRLLKKHHLYFEPYCLFDFFQQLKLFECLFVLFWFQNRSRIFNLLISCYSRILDSSLLASESLKKMLQKSRIRPSWCRFN